MIQNLHTHTVFCDGKNTPEEMIQYSIKKGMKSLGFSGHSPFPYENDYTMTNENLPLYIDEINRLKEKYDGVIDIFLGIEQEIAYKIDTSKFDYVISSAHGIVRGNRLEEVDNQKEILLDNIKKYSAGDVYSHIEEYYNNVIRASKNGDILGHFDLVTKFNGENDIFDEHGKKYLDIAFSALEKCISNEIIIEVNTGAIQREYRKRFYPDTCFLNFIKENNAKIIIGTDAHIDIGVDFYYDETVEILKNHGFKSQMILTKNGFKEINL